MLDNKDTMKYFVFDLKFYSRLIKSKSSGEGNGNPYHLVCFTQSIFINILFICAD